MTVKEVIDALRKYPDSMTVSLEHGQILGAECGRWHPLVTNPTESKYGRNFSRKPLPDLLKIDEESLGEVPSSKASWDNLTLIQKLRRMESDAEKNGLSEKESLLFRRIAAALFVTERRLHTYNTIPLVLEISEELKTDAFSSSGISLAMIQAKFALKDARQVLRDR